MSGENGSEKIKDILKEALDKKIILKIN